MLSIKKIVLTAIAIKVKFNDATKFSTFQCNEERVVGKHILKKGINRNKKSTSNFKVKF